MGRFEKDAAAAYESWMLDFIRRRIYIYQKFLVETDMDGVVLGLKDRIMNRNEIEKILYKKITEAEKLEYEQAAEGLEKEMLEQKEYYTHLAEPGILPLEYVFQIFRLNIFEQYCVMLSYAVELDKRLENLFFLIQDDFSLKCPTIDTAIAMYTLDERKRASLLTIFYQKDSKLHYLFGKSGQLHGQSNLGRMLKLDGRMLEFIKGGTMENERILHFTDYVFPKTKENPTLNLQQEIFEKVVQLEQEGQQYFCFYGNKGGGKKFQSACIGNYKGQVLLQVDTYGLFEQTEYYKEWLEELLRERTLHQAILCFLHFEQIENMLIHPDSRDKTLQKLNILCKYLGKIKGPTLFLSEHPLRQTRDLFQPIEFQVGILEVSGKVWLWEQALEGLPFTEAVEGNYLAEKYQFTPGQIIGIGKRLWRQLRMQESKRLPAGLLYQYCREAVGITDISHASILPPVFCWEDLVLPEKQKQRMKEACLQVEMQYFVYETWGFQEKMPYGRTVSVLLYGPSGTGKTMAAQVMANHLHMELLKADLSGILSKYIGETEKNLSGLFEQAKRGQYILFFDEADVLFGKRSEMKDSHDRHANAQTAFLLQKIEEFEGMVILATNLFMNFDPAFLRRIKFVIELALPEEKERYRLWVQAFTEKIPMSEDIDFHFLARQFAISAGNIKNIAMKAAFLASGQEEKILIMKYIIEASVDEMKKIGMNVGAEELLDYAYLLDGGDNGP